jgi:FKBP-type peptidyl-prolyl cis-trans isomerase SlyD
MQVQNDMVVSLSYRLHVDDGESGKQFLEEATDKKPMVFLYGHQSILPKFEEEIKGLKVGDTFNFFIDFENAYGDYDERKLVSLPKTSFKDEKGRINKDLMKVGKVVPMTDSKGNHMHGTVMKVTLGSVEMDFNHKLAGYDLYFEGKVLDLRQAEPEEIAHGHVHGPGGHQH